MNFDDLDRLMPVLYAVYREGMMNLSQGFKGVIR